MSLQDLAGGLAAGLAVVILLSPSLVDWSEAAPTAAPARSLEPVQAEADRDSTWAAFSGWREAVADFLGREDEDARASCSDAPAQAGLFAAGRAGDYCPIDGH